MEISEQRWAINLEWLQANNRSFNTMVKSTLCPKCQKKLKLNDRKTKPGDLLKAIKSCCSRNDDFITPVMPLQESVFRVFLSSGNEALNLEDLANLLNKKRGLDTIPVSLPLLSRLLNSDSYYGFRPVSL